MSGTYSTLVDNHFDETTRHRVFICNESGERIGDHFIDKHERFDWASTTGTRQP